MSDRSELQAGLVSVAAGIALLVVILGAWALQKQAARHKVKWDQVLSASRELKAGDILTHDDLTTRSVPVQNVSANALRKAEEAVGQRLLVPVASGDEIHKSFFASGSAVCRDAKLLEKACTGTKTRTPCKLTLSGYLVGTYGCQASWDPGSNWLDVTTDAPELDLSFGVAFPEGHAPSFKTPYRDRQLASISVSLDSTGAKRGPNFTVQKSTDTKGTLGTLTATLDSVDPDVGWPHGTISATALPLCVVEETCKAEGQPSVQIGVSF